MNIQAESTIERIPGKWRVLLLLSLAGIAAMQTLRRSPSASKLAGGRR